MNAEGRDILEQLRAVEAQRARRAQDAALSSAVHDIKRYQHRRFHHTYADLLASARYTHAARFFLDELYGPEDFSRRDAQFARVVPALVRLFPHEVVLTVRTLARLHALAEELDTQMALANGAQPLDGDAYAAAWRAVGRPADRERQIMLTRQVGDALDVYTRNPLLRHSLRLMRRPAQLAGMAELQRFLEGGFDTFRAMRGAGEFLDTVVQRERALAAALFDGQMPSGGLPG